MVHICMCVPLRGNQVLQEIIKGGNWWEKKSWLGGGGCSSTCSLVENQSIFIWMFSFFFSPGKFFLKTQPQQKKPQLIEEFIPWIMDTHFKTKQNKKQLPHFHSMCPYEDFSPLFFPFSYNRNIKQQQQQKKLNLYKN